MACLLDPNREPGTTTGTPQVSRFDRTEDLLASYLGSDLRRLQQDVETRPSHYTESQKALATALLRDTRHGTATERSDLLLQFMRPSASQSKEREIRRNLSATKKGEKPPPFERQELFKDAIVLI